MMQDRLAALVVHGRTLIATVELGERWPPRDLAVRCDEVLGGDDVLTRLWPLVDAERRAARVVLGGVRLSDLREVVLRLAVLTGTDLSVLSVPDADPTSSGGDEQRGGASRRGRWGQGRRALMSHVSALVVNSAENRAPAHMPALLIGAQRSTIVAPAGSPLAASNSTSSSSTCAARGHPMHLPD
jgi:hypothetical protein